MRRFSRFLTRNWGLKLLAFLLALVLWLTLIPEERTFSEKTLTIPLETHNLPADMELVERPPAAIDVTVRAPNRLIDQITPSNVFAKLSLARANLLQEEYPLNMAMISVPAGAEVTKVYPSKVRIKLERTREVQMEIVPGLIGQLREGLRVERVDVLPATVLVKGPESRIKKRDSVRTTPIDISAFTQSSEVEADLILPHPDLRLSTSQIRVKVRVAIGEAEKPAANAAPRKK